MPTVLLLKDGRGDHPRASRINPQGDDGTSGIRPRQEIGSPKVKEWASVDDYAPLNGSWAYYNYHRNLKANVFLVNLAQIAIDARKRNFAFFDRLGIKCD